MSFAILLRKHCRNRGDEPSREEKGFITDLQKHG